MERGKRDVSACRVLYVLYWRYQPKDEEKRMVAEMWHCFTVADTYTGVSRVFRWREAICDYCGVVYQFQMYDGMCGRWILMRSFVDLDDGFEYFRNFDFKEFYRTYGERWV